MAALLLFITLLVGATGRNTPTKDYIPTKDQLDLIFGTGSPATMSDASVFSWNVGAPLKEASNKSENKTTEKVDLNSRTNVTSDKQNVVIGGEVDTKLNSTAGSDPKGNLDDRMALGATACVGGVRAGNKCVKGV